MKRILRTLRGLYLSATHNGDIGELVACAVVLVLGFAVGIAAWIALV